MEVMVQGTGAQTKTNSLRSKSTQEGQGLQGKDTTQPTRCRFAQKRSKDTRLGDPTQWRGQDHGKDHGGIGGLIKDIVDKTDQF
jgi:hypothetical protein